MKIYSFILALMLCLNGGLIAGSDSESDSDIDWDAISTPGSSGGCAAAGAARSRADSISDQIGDKPALPLGRKRRDFTGDLGESTESGGSWGGDFGGDAALGQLAALMQQQRAQSAALAAMPTNTSIIMLVKKEGLDASLITRAIPFKCLEVAFRVKSVATTDSEGVNVIRVEFEQEHSFETLQEQFGKLNGVTKVKGNDPDLATRQARKHRKASMLRHRYDSRRALQQQQGE